MRCLNPRKVSLRRTGIEEIDLKNSLMPASLNRDKASVPCGECINCRIDESRVWRNRLLLEQLTHGQSCFVTLTYEDRYLPDPAHISKKEVQDFLKRLRYNVEPTKFRYFAVGEYGDKSFRPHYHLALFNLHYELHKRVIFSSWGKCKEDAYDIGELNSGSVSYITGYITKKTLKDEGKHPVNYGKPDEFSLKSKGLGKGAVDKITESLQKNPHRKREIYSLFRYNGSLKPFGRYLKNRLNDFQNITDTERLLAFWSGQMKYAEDRINPAIAKKAMDRRTIL